MASIRDRDFYAQVAHELATGNLDSGLWAMALSEADGLEEKAKARYLKLRAEH